MKFTENQKWKKCGKDYMIMGSFIFGENVIRFGK
jgi:hypothetical protein